MCTALALSAKILAAGETTSRSELHELDVELLVAEWEKAGHKLPINANKAASLVLARMGSMESAGFMLKKSSAT